MKSFPEGPTATVVFFPRRMKVKTSPNWEEESVVRSGAYQSDWPVSTYLSAVRLEECGRVHAVGDGAPDEGEPGEDHGRLIGIPEEDLVGDMEEDGENNDPSKHHGDLGGHGECLEVLGERVHRHVLEEAHCDCASRRQRKMSRRDPLG